MKKKKKRNYGKTGIFTQSEYSTKFILFVWYNSKINDRLCLECSPNVRITIMFYYVPTYSLFFFKLTIYTFQFK